MTDVCAIELFNEFVERGGGVIAQFYIKKKKNTKTKKKHSKSLIFYTKMSAGACHPF